MMNVYEKERLVAVALVGTVLNAAYFSLAMLILAVHIHVGHVRLRIQLIAIDCWDFLQ
jgi:hypothetical protein